MRQAKTPAELQNEFGPRVLRIGMLLPMLEPWNNPLYITRAWCLYELCVALHHLAAMLQGTAHVPSASTPTHSRIARLFLRKR
jgi:hypothetical protein